MTSINRTWALALLTTAPSLQVASPVTVVTNPASIEADAARDARHPDIDQRLIDWQRERADEYYRRLRKYVASVGRMA